MYIVTYPHVALRTPSDPVTTPMLLLESGMPATLMDVDVLAESMVEMMRAAGGVGLAGPQVWANKRIWVADLDGKITVAINPEVVEAPSAELVADYEGCLSIPGVLVEVERPSSVILTCQHSLVGHRYSFQYDGLAARIIQHETDHLNGYLIIDRKAVPSSSHPLPVTRYPTFDYSPFLRRFPNSGEDFVAWFVANRAKVAKEFLVDDVRVDLSHPAILYRVGDRTMRENL